MCKWGNYQAAERAFSYLHLKKNLLTWKFPPNYFKCAHFNAFCEKKKKNISENSSKGILPKRAN